MVGLSIQSRFGMMPTSAISSWGYSSVLEFNGTIRGFPARIVWDDGALVGDEWAVFKLNLILDDAEGKEVTYHPVEVPELEGHRHRSKSVIVLAMGLFDKGVEITGNLPREPTLPDGAEW